MIAVDTNLLVYAHREDSPWHQPAYACVERLAEGAFTWAIPWPCLHEFLAIVTHPRIYAPPTPMEVAFNQVNAWFQSPTLILLHETQDHWIDLQEILEKGRVTGPQVHDARIACLCRGHGVRELWTADRDFSHFPGISAKNPLIQ